jgi:hypothetical protein
MALIGVWTIRGSLAIASGTVRAGVQYAASSSNRALIIGVGVTQNGSLVSAMDEVRISRMSAAATVTAGVTGTSVHDLTWGGSGNFQGTLSTTATGSNAITAGTVSDTPFQRDFNVLSGYERDFQPDARIFVPASGIVTLSTGALNSLTFNFELTVLEMQ